MTEADRTYKHRSYCCTDREYEIIKRRAAKMQVSVSEFIRRAATRGIIADDYLRSTVERNTRTMQAVLGRLEDLNQKKRLP